MKLILAYLFKCNSVHFHFAIQDLVCAFMFNEEEMIENKNFNENDKELILKCIRLFEYLFYLETGKEIKHSEEIFDQRVVKHILDRLSGRVFDNLKSSIEWRIQENKFIITKVDYRDDMNFDLLINDIQLYKYNRNEKDHYCKYKIFNKFKLKNEYMSLLLSID